MRLTLNQRRATETVENFLRALEETGIITINDDRREFLVRQFGLLRAGDTGPDLADVMITVLDVLHLASTADPATLAPYCDPDHTHCDDCGELIDSARAGCQSAGPDNGCKGFDYRRDVCGIEDPLFF